MSSDFERPDHPADGGRPAYKPPAYVTFQNNKKDASLARPLLLAGLMLLALALLAPAVRLLNVQDPRGVRVDDVEELELEPPPEVPEPSFVPEPEFWPEIPDPFGGERFSRPPEAFRVRSDELFEGLLRNPDELRELGLRLREERLEFQQVGE